MSIADAQRLTKLRRDQLHERLRIVPMIKDPNQFPEWATSRKLDENGKAEWITTEVCTVIGALVVDPQTGKMLTHMLLPEETHCSLGSTFQINMSLTQ